jgi:hypothetical protein
MLRFVCGESTPLRELVAGNRTRILITPSEVYHTKTKISLCMKRQGCFTCHRQPCCRSVVTDWDEILSADCSVGALPHLVCCVEATMVVDPRIPWEWGRVFLKIQGWSGSRSSRPRVDRPCMDPHGIVGRRAS